MSDSKTIGDAANRLVDGVEALAKAAEKVAPDAWESAVDAHRNAAIVAMVSWLLFAVTLAFIARLAIQWAGKDENRHADVPPPVARGVAWCLVLCAALSVAAALEGNLAQAINPEWYAAQSIMYAVGR